MAFTFVFCTYQSDNGLSYVVKVSQNTATQGGFAAFTGSIGSANIWPYGAKNMRHVWGINGSTGKRAKMPIASNANAKYKNGGSFSTPGGSFAIEGAIGEARKLNHIA